ncbi:MAG: ABC transporter permease [Pleurocapsa sp. SU_196_0]|nr:ABC transporter permease [Pleurocapsa sp. SU_196_0]
MIASRRGNTVLARVSGQPWALALTLLIVSSVIVLVLQPGYFEGRTLANNLRSYLPLMCLAVAQTIIVIGGGIDLSIGAVLTLSSVVMVRVFGENPGALEVALGVGAGVLVGTLAGAVNGWSVAYLRLQPIIATFATASLWSGAALWVLPQPGGVVPQGVQDFVRFNPLIPFALVVIRAADSRLAVFPRHESRPCAVCRGWRTAGGILERCQRGPREARQLRGGRVRHEPRRVLPHRGNATGDRSSVRRSPSRASSRWSSVARACPAARAVPWAASSAWSCCRCCDR